jgi:hypothetical protein
LGATGLEKPDSFPVGIGGLRGDSGKTKDKMGPTDDTPVDPFGDYAG